MAKMCARSKCDRYAQDGSNYCATHEPTAQFGNQLESDDKRQQQQQQQQQQQERQQKQQQQ